MAKAARRLSARGPLLALFALSLTVFALQLTVVRPHLWPAGAGVTVSGDLVLGRLSEPRALARIRPPDLNDEIGTAIVVTRVRSDSDATRAGVAVGLELTPPLDVDSALRTWRDTYRRWASERAQITVVDARSGQALTWRPQAVGELDAGARQSWLRQHLGPLMQMAGFLAGAVLMVALGSRGSTATLMTMALIFTAVANGGPLFGAELAVPVVGPLLLLFGWMVTSFSFPVIGLAVLYFPSRSPLLQRHPSVYVVLALLPAPILLSSLAAAAFLLGVDAAGSPLAWFATHGWLFDLSFAAALGANVLIVIEGIYRYRTNVDANERRRIQIVVYTGIPAVFAYAIKTGVPLVSALLARPLELAWPVEALLQLIILLPAVALPYAVAVKHVFSPRTVLRQSLQYALAKKTLSVLILLPLVALVVSLLTQRDRPLGEIILGQPLFYALGVGLIAFGRRYRDQAQRWIDRRFFRAEYDAREILLSLAARVPYEADRGRLIDLVMSETDNALHPESIAVLAGDGQRLEVIAALRTTPRSLSRDGGLATVLRWSDEPLEIFLDDERSPAARLPPEDRAWLTDSGVSLLVPISSGSSGVGEQRWLIGVIALGRKRSEEPYASDDRLLLSGIATQLHVALDLSRLRRNASLGSGSAASATPTLTPTMVSAAAAQATALIVMCPSCHRCFEAADATTGTLRTHCPDEGATLQPVVGMVAVVDGKYRIDSVVGRGGMGAVFRARDLRLDRDVAIKVVRAELVGDPASQARFQREAQIVARLQHPSIVTVFDYGALPDGAAFLVMEYVRGEDLRHLIKRDAPLAPSRVVALLEGVAAGVDAAHRAGVLHRDLKPENILLPASGGGPKVLDFGVAKIADASVGGAGLTVGATIVGTPAYMAPEQLRGEAIDERADVYSLAVVTYESLTGKLPFGAGSFIDIGIRQSSGSDAVRFDGVPDRLAATLRRALAVDRDERPRSARELAQALRSGEA